MERINIKNFQDKIKEAAYCAVVFSSKDCPPCDFHKESIEKVTSMFPDVVFYEFYRDQINSKEILDKHRVKLIPRTIFFKDGVEVGRTLLEKTPQKIAFFVNQLMTQGRVIDPEDAEEICILMDKVIAAKDWEITHDNFEEKSSQIREITEKVMEDVTDWPSTSIEDIKRYV